MRPAAPTFRPMRRPPARPTCQENLDYARRLARTGVPIEFHLFPGAFHAFELQADAYVSRQARQLSQSALRRFLAPRT